MCQISLEEQSCWEAWTEDGRTVPYESDTFFETLNSWSWEVVSLYSTDKTLVWKFWSIILQSRRVSFPPNVIVRCWFYDSSVIILNFIVLNFAFKRSAIEERERVNDLISLPKAEYVHHKCCQRITHPHSGFTRFAGRGVEKTLNQYHFFHVRFCLSAKAKPVHLCCYDKLRFYKHLDLTPKKSSAFFWTVNT